MSVAIFLPDDFTETLEIEAKLAHGREGRGELPQSFWETYPALTNSQGGTVSHFKSPAFSGLERQVHLDESRP